MITAIPFISKQPKLKTKLICEYSTRICVATITELRTHQMLTEFDVFGNF